MKKEFEKVSLSNGNNILISNVTADEISDKDKLKITYNQIENKVRWRESVNKMVNE